MIGPSQAASVLPRIACACSQWFGWRSWKGVGKLHRLRTRRAAVGQCFGGQDYLPSGSIDWCAHPGHICTGLGLTPATYAPESGSRQPNLHRDLRSPPATSAPGLNLPQLHPDWADPCHITTRTASTGTALGGALSVGDVLVRLTGLHRCMLCAVCHALCR